MSRSIRRWALTSIVALATVACGGAIVTPPTSPTPVPQIEVFSGTLTRNGAATHTFTSQAGGTVTASLTSISPDAVVGLSLGTWNGLACQVVIANDAAVLNTVVTGTVSAIGNLCVRVYDVGQFAEPTSYEVQILHP